MSLEQVLLGAFLVVVGATAGLYGLHRLGLWAEDRGYIYYKHKKGTGDSFHNTAMELEKFYKPSVEYSIVAEEVQAAPDEKDGE